MNHKLQGCLDLVDCRPDAVLDVPLDRRGVPPESDGNPEVAPKSLGETQLYFGKHAGKRLKEVPREYLEWALNTKPGNSSFCKFQRMAGEYLEASAA